jgi:hypothetical protein
LRPNSPGAGQISSSTTAHTPTTHANADTA